MSTEVKVPTLGESVTEATIGEWLKQPGEAVALDEPIASLETDKVAVEVPSPVAGVMGQQVVAVGDTVNVGAVIATIEAGDGRAAAPRLRPRRRPKRRRPLLRRPAARMPSSPCRPRCAASSSSTALIRARSRAPARTAA